MPQSGDCDSGRMDGQETDDDDDVEDKETLRTSRVRVRENATANHTHGCALRVLQNLTERPASRYFRLCRAANNPFSIAVYIYEGAGDDCLSLTFELMQIYTPDQNHLLPVLTTHIAWNPSARYCTARQKSSCTRLPI